MVAPQLFSDSRPQCSEQILHDDIGVEIASSLIDHVVKRRQLEFEFSVGSG